MGLIAGAGDLPRLVAEGIRRAGRGLVVVGLRGWADPALQRQADRFSWRGIARIGGWIRDLRRAGCREAIMVGRVSKADMFALPRWRQWLLYLPDWTSIRIWYGGMQDRRNHSVLAAVANELERKGVPLVDSTQYCLEALATAGPMTGWTPARRILDDAEFAWPLLKQIAALDIGQSLAVKEREVIAVEAVEGTDRLIARAGELCPTGGWTLVKAARQDQDMRYDVPTIGPGTIENLARAKAAAVVVEAGKTLILERARTLDLAARHHITVIGRTAETPLLPA